MVLAVAAYSLIALVTLAWSLFAAKNLHTQRHMSTLEPETEVDSIAVPPSISVVVPARNEEDGIEPALRSLLAQRGVSIEIIAVDDSSTDGTGAILERLASEEPRLRLLRSPALPDGWLGKTNAMHQGAALATGDLLLFTDADIVHAPGSLAAAARAMERDGLDFLTLAPRYRWQSLVEHAWVASMFLVLLMFGSARYRDPEAPDEAVGVGAFMMLRRQVYRALGGHAAIRGSIVDDADLGLLVKRASHAIDARFAPRCLEVRMYRGNRAAFWAFTKHAMGLFQGSVLKAALLTAMFSAIFLTGPLAALAGLAIASWSLAAAGLGLYLLQYGSLFIIRSWQDFHSLRLLAFPLFAPMTIACTVRAAYYWLCKGSVLWRGREVRLGRGERRPL